MGRLANNITKTKLKTGNLFIKLFGQRYGVDTTMATNIWDAFIKVKKEVYPKPKSDWTLISLREAEKNLDGKIHRHGIKRKVDEGVFYSKDGKVYQEEIELVRSMFLLHDYFQKAGAIVDTEDVSGRKIYAVIPQSAPKLNEKKEDVYIKTVSKLIQHPFIQKWSKEVDKITKNKPSE